MMGALTFNETLWQLTKAPLNRWVWWRKYGGRGTGVVIVVVVAEAAAAEAAVVKTLPP